MSLLDFNDAQTQRAGDLIPDGTVVPVHMSVRPGGAGPDGWLKLTKMGDAEMLDCEFTVTEGPHAKRKFWSNMMVSGATDGQLKAADISKARLRAILESARGVNPSDESEKAVAARRVSSWEDFDGVRFVAIVSVEKGKDGYADKNGLKAVVTPDSNKWAQLEQVTKAVTQAAPKAPVGNKPSWAA